MCHCTVLKSLLSLLNLHVFPLQNLLAVAVATDITFKEAEQVRTSIELTSSCVIPAWPMIILLLEKN